MLKNLFQKVGRFSLALSKNKRKVKMNREELKKQIDELMRQYADEEIGGDTYAQKMMELTTSTQNENNDE